MCVNLILGHTYYEHNPVLERIRFLGEKGLTSMTVLHDYFPLQERSRPVWMYTRVNNTMRLERGDRSDLEGGALVMALSKLSTDPSFADFITHPGHCLPICTNQAMRSFLLKALPTLDDIDITRLQRGNESHGVQIPGMDATGGRCGTDTAMGSSKGKGKAAPSISSDDEVSSNEDIHLQRQRRLLCSDKSMVGKPPLSWERAAEKVTAPQPDPRWLH
jgi:hypothetical protein